MDLSFLNTLIFNLLIFLERKKVGVSKKEITVGDHQIHYLEGGKGETVICLHGFGGDKDVWVRFLQYLTPRYHVIVPDIPGFGESTRLESACYDISHQAKRLQEFTKKLGLKSFHLIGNSMGGHIAGVYAHHHPEQVKSLGLLCTAGISSPVKNEFQEALGQGQNSLLIESAEDFKKFLNFVFVKVPWIPKPILRYYTEQSIRHRHFNEKIFADIFGPEKFLLQKLLPQISTKTLILWGDTDYILHVSCVKVLERGLQNHQTVIMKNCGHSPMAERPKETAGHYLDFL